MQTPPHPPTLSLNRPVVAYPAPFTACAQQLPGSGAWVAPSAERPGEWLVLRPVLLPRGADRGGGGNGGGERGGSQRSRGGGGDGGDGGGGGGGESGSSESEEEGAVVDDGEAS